MDNKFLNSIPEEDQITKQDLWDFIIKSRVHFEKKLEDQSASLAYQIAVINDRMNIKLGDAKGELIQMAEHEMADLQSMLTQGRKVLEGLLNKTQTEIQAKMKQQSEKVDKALQALDTRVPSLAKSEIDKNLSELTELSNKLSKDISVYRKETNDYISKFQLETKSKIDSINRKLNSILSKFKVIADEIGE